MANLLAIKARYLELVSQSNELFAKVNNSPASTRIAYESEVSAIDFAIMKLGKLIRKSPGIQADSLGQIDLPSLKNRVTEIIRLIHETPGQESVSRIAVNAFTAGVIGGAIHGIVERNFTSKSEETDSALLSRREEEIGELVICAHGTKASRMAQQSKINEAQIALKAAELAMNQAQENTKQAYIEVLKSTDVSLFPPGVSVNVGTAVSEAPKLVQAKFEEELANTRYNEALAYFAQTQVVVSREERSAVRQDPPQEKSFWHVVWNGTKLTFGFVINIFSAKY